MDDFFAFREVSRFFRQSLGFFAGQREVRAVDGVTLSIRKGETLGLVGESGCGKSTLARMAVGLLAPSAGEVLLEGKVIFSAADPAAPMLPHRIQMVFQDPYSSLNPRMSVGANVGEALTCAGVGRSEREERVAEMFRHVGLDPSFARRYPHQFSGGQRQRLAIARALITKPDFVVCDEPVSSLDASIQAQVLGLLKDMQEAFGLTYLFISHDLAVISHMSDRIAVMRRGKIVEEAPAAKLFAEPAHEYTRSLLAATPAREYAFGPAEEHPHAPAS